MAIGRYEPHARSSACPVRLSQAVRPTPSPGALTLHPYLTTANPGRARRYALLRKDLAALYSYLQLIPPAELPAIFKPEVSDAVLVSIASAFAAHVTAADATWAATWLHALSKVGRFQMTVMMLDKKATAALASMFEAMEAAGAAGGELAKLRGVYLSK